MRPAISYGLDSLQGTFTATAHSRKIQYRWDSGSGLEVVIRTLYVSFVFLRKHDMLAELTKEMRKS